MIDESKKRLREYIENDKIYQDYKNSDKEPTDFERFCFVHCRDIENVLNELEQLKEDIKNIIKILCKNCDDLEATEEEFDSLYRWQNE